jgi:CBS domain-containing protein
MTSEKIRNIAVSDFMTTKVKTITEDETMKQACKLMYQENIGSIVIITKNTDSHDMKRTPKNEETPVGIVTERDIARMIGFSAKFFTDMSVSELMSKPLIIVAPNTSVALMEQKDIRRLPVVDGKGHMAGIITAKDILKAVMNIFKENIKDQDLMSEGFDLLGLLGAE